MSWITLSVPIYEGMAVYKNHPDKQPRLQRTRTFEKDAMQETMLLLPLHTGTHIDYPRHAIAGGKTSSDYILFPMEARGYVLDLSTSPPESIGPEHLSDLNLHSLDFVFIKTRQTPLETFDFNFPYLNKDAAILLAQYPLKFVGTDHPGIERNQPDHDTHIALLQKDILIIEGLALHKVNHGPLTAIFSSLSLKDSDSEPITVLTSSSQ